MATRWLRGPAAKQTNLPGGNLLPRRKVGKRRRGPAASGYVGYQAARPDEPAGSPSKVPIFMSVPSAWMAKAEML